MDHHTLFPSGGAAADDIDQAGLGNCYALAAAGAVADQMPGFIENMFFNTELTENGVYAVNIYAMGVPHTIVFDDWIPTYGASGLSTPFAQPGEEGSLWMVLLEKALAKYYGNYGHLEGGLTEVAVRTLTGAPGMRMRHD